MATKISRPLRPGDEVALVNPAGVLPERFRNQYGYVKAYLQELGFKVRDFVIENGWEDAQRRSDALNSAFADSNVKAIFPLCGGARIYEVLPLIDYDALAKCPKIICGSSELSALMLAITERSGLVTFHGPHLNFVNPKASKRENSFTVRSFWNMLEWDWHGKNGLSKNEAYHFFASPRTSESPIVIRNIYRRPELIANESYRDNFYCSSQSNKNVTGELLIGSLESVTKLCEIDLCPNVSGKIIMLDSLDMPLSSVIETIKKLNTFCGLSSAAAIVFSSLTERTDRENLLYPELRDPNQVQNFLREISGLFDEGTPIFHGFPVGHCAYKLTLPIGVTVTIEVGSGNLILRESPYK